MRLIALEHELKHLDPATAAEVLRAEAKALWALQQEGLVREAHFRTDRKEAVLILEVKDMAEAEVRLSAMPLVQQGYIRFELIPLAPYDGFARLFVH